MRARAATLGERWSRELLRELGEGGYRPHAWTAFLRRSFERAAGTRRARPSLARQADTWLRGWLAASAAARIPALARLLPRVPAAAELRWWTATALLLRWHIGMVEGPRGEPRERLGAADALALARVWTAPRLVRASEPRAFLALLTAVGVADAVDGPLARRSGVTRLGRELDRLADACAFVAAVGAARRAGWITAWASRAFAVRYAAGTGYVTAHYLLRATPPQPAARDVTRAVTPAFVLGLGAGALGARRAGSAAVGAASLTALAAQALAAAGPQGWAAEGALGREAASRSASAAEPARLHSSTRARSSTRSTV